MTNTINVGQGETLATVCRPLPAPPALRRDRGEDATPDPPGPRASPHPLGVARPTVINMYEGDLGTTAKWCLLLPRPLRLTVMALHSHG